MRRWPPLHRSARVRGPEPVKSSPNAVHAEDAGHATLLRKMSWPPGGLGVAWTCQGVPFQRSARVATPELPTAVPAADHGAAPPPRVLPCLAAVGGGTLRLLLRFHRSAS